MRCEGPVTAPATIRVPTPSNPVPIGTNLRTPCGRVGTVVDYECPGGVILYVVEVTT